MTLTAVHDADTLATTLDEIKLRYEIIGVVSAPHDDVNTSKPKPGSKAPTSVHLLSMRDPRTVWRQPGDVLSVPGTLHKWYVEVAARLWITLDGRPMHGVDYYCDWLNKFMQRIPQDLLDGMGSDILVLRNQLREVTGEPTPRPIGYCECGEPLFYTDGDPFLLCNHCGTMYDTLSLVEQITTDQGGQTLVTRATLAKWFGRSEHTIRARCNVVEYDDMGRALYDAHESKRVLESTARRLRT